MPSQYHEIHITSTASFEVIDITSQVRACVSQSGIREGMLTLSSLHTTCALVINENEKLLLEDMRKFFLALVPPHAGYEHDKLHLRPDIPADEPENAHAHLIAMLAGNSESLAIHDGAPVLGRYQSILVLELDGPRERRLALQLVGE